jgi:hypothetical protein
MSFLLEGPVPGLVTSTVLPSPLFSNSNAAQHDINVKRAIDGTRRTYVKSIPRRKLIWNFRLDREKGLELRQFLSVYFADQLKVTDQDGIVWFGYLTNNPFEFDTPGRAGRSQSTIAGVRAERQTITIEFEGTQ